jgi:hypothetical protein
MNLHLHLHLYLHINLEHHKAKAHGAMRYSYVPVTPPGWIWIHLGQHRPQ